MAAVAGTRLVEMVVVDVANQAGDADAEHRIMRMATEVTAVMMGVCVMTAARILFGNGGSFCCFSSSSQLIN